MKVILLRDVAKLGKRFAVIEVPDGYALNKLIPQGMAETATPENLKKVAATADKRAHNSVNQHEAFMAACALLKTQAVVVTATANAQDHLFQAIKVSDITTALKAAGISAITEEMITIVEPIKALGEYEVPVAHARATGAIHLQIIRR